jgi:hypothetical protein
LPLLKRHIAPAHLPAHACLKVIFNRRVPFALYRLGPQIAGVARVAADAQGEQVVLVLVYKGDPPALPGWQ